MVTRLLAVTGLLLSFAASALSQELDQPLKKAKVGDYAVYTSSGNQVTMTMKVEVTEVKDMKVTVRTTSTVNGNDLPPTEQVYDLTKKFDPTEALKQKNKDLKVVDTGTGKETLKVGGKEYPCEWRSNTVTASVNGQEYVSQSKVWICMDGPVYGLVRTETTVMGQVYLMELKEAGSKKE
jgi:hypothetical protein